MGTVESKRVVIDTNVVVSPLLFGGIPGKLIELWKTGVIQPLASQEIIDDYLKVLAYPKFELSEEEINFLLYHEILPYFEAVEAKATRAIIRNDPSDDKFIHCATGGNAHTVISGDEHLLALKSHQGIKILPLSQFLKDLNQQSMDS